MPAAARVGLGSYDRSMDLEVTNELVYRRGPSPWSIRNAVRPGGRFAFSSRNPADRAWERWGGGAFLENGRVRWHTGRFENGRVHANAQDSTLVYGDEILIAGSEYRIRTLDEVRDSLAGAGLEIDQLYGGWDRRPLGAAGEDLVFVAKRA